MVPATLRRSIGSAITLGLFGGAAWFLWKELRTTSINEIVAFTKTIPPTHILLAMALTGINLVVLTWYDFLAFRYIGKTLPYSKIGFAAFLGYTFSNALGLPLLTGSAVRYRLYSSWGLSGVDISRILFFNYTSFWMGAVVIAGTFLCIFPFAIPFAAPLSAISLRAAGITCIISVALLVFVSFKKRSPTLFFGHSITLPTPELLLSQLAVSSLDWLLAAAIPFVLFTHVKAFSFLHFAGIFILGQIVGVLSSVPAGIGVFEGVIVSLLSGVLPKTQIIGTLIDYRIIYYLFPLLCASISLGLFEIYNRFHHFSALSKTMQRSLGQIIPPLYAILLFICGGILLFSGSLPAVPERMRFLTFILPLPIVEISHLLGSILGVVLLIVAYGIYRRLDGVYLYTIIFLFLGSTVSLLKGFDYEEATIMSVMLIAFLPTRRYFYRKSAFFSETFSPFWLVTIVGILGTSFLIGVFSYKNITYSHDLWWRFTFSASAPRFLRAYLGASITVLVASLLFLLRPKKTAVSMVSDEDTALVRTLVRLHGDASAHLALVGDKRFFISPNSTSFIMYGISGNCWISMGDPIGLKDDFSELVWNFREQCDIYNGIPAFYQISDTNLSLYIDQGLSLTKIGETAMVDLPSFSLAGGSKKSIRRKVHDLDNQGYFLRIVPGEELTPYLPVLRTISDQWLTQKKTREKKFSVGHFNDDYLRMAPCALVCKGDNVVAFANLWTSFAQKELSGDLMRYADAAPHGTMDYLFIKIFEWGRDNGFETFNLGMAPFSGLDIRPLSPLWNRIGHLLYRRAESFYNFQGVRQYKEKFDPVWKPKYLASPAGLSLVTVLSNIASLIAGGVKGIVMK
jgi:phosphatidylglycerol lysyltransferase